VAESVSYYISQKKLHIGVGSTETLSFVKGVKVLQLLLLMCSPFNYANIACKLLQFCEYNMGTLQILRQTEMCTSD